MYTEINGNDWWWDAAILLQIRPWDKEALALFFWYLIKSLGTQRFFLPIFELRE